MTECRGLKLFGKMIPVPTEGSVLEAPFEEGEGDGAEMVLVLEMVAQGSGKESPTGGENKKSSHAGEVEKNPNPDEEEQSGSPSPPEKKAITKPDKILPCPRCNSMDTKFCYYNNYNPGQPRHFCRGCQRYWTAGGAMRNLPVGAGRRKSKRTTDLHCRHIAVAEASLQGVHHRPVLKPNGILLSFGSNKPHPCTSMALALNLVEQRMPSWGGVENGEEHSSGSSVTASNSTEEAFGANFQEAIPQSSRASLPQVTCINESLWPPLWSSAPAFPCSSFPISFYPTTPYWGCAQPKQPMPPPSDPNSGGSSGSAPNSLTLGKHLREENVLAQINSERRLWVPKTLRIGDPEVAAKSSVWAAMAIKDGKASRVGGGGLFKGFNQAKAETRKQAVHTCPALQANPAALSRSVNFNESL